MRSSLGKFETQNETVCLEMPCNLWDSWHGLVATSINIYGVLDERATAFFKVYLFIYFLQGTGEMSHWLRALGVLLEDPYLIPSSHTATDNCL